MKKLFFVDKIPNEPLELISKKILDIAKSLRLSPKNDSVLTNNIFTPIKATKCVESPKSWASPNTERLIDGSGMNSVGVRATTTVSYSQILEKTVGHSEGLDKKIGEYLGYLSSKNTTQAIYSFVRRSYLNFKDDVLQLYHENLNLSRRCNKLKFKIESLKKNGFDRKMDIMRALRNKSLSPNHQNEKNSRLENVRLYYLKGRLK